MTDYTGLCKAAEERRRQVEEMWAREDRRDWECEHGERPAPAGPGTFSDAELLPPHKPFDVVAWARAKADAEREEAFSGMPQRDPLTEEDIDRMAAEDEARRLSAIQDEERTEGRPMRHKISNYED